MLTNTSADLGELIARRSPINRQPFSRLHIVRVLIELTGARSLYADGAVVLVGRGLLTRRLEVAEHDTSDLILEKRDHEMGISRLRQN
jgi:hypothetical protein